MNIIVSVVVSQIGAYAHKLKIICIKIFNITRQKVYSLWEIIIKFLALTSLPITKNFSIVFHITFYFSCFVSRQIEPIHCLYKQFNIWENTICKNNFKHFTMTDNFTIFINFTASTVCKSTIYGMQKKHLSWRHVRLLILGSSIYCSFR